MQEQQDAIRMFREQDIAGKSTGELVLLLYETGVLACQRRDRSMTLGVLMELLGAIDLRGGDIAKGLIRLYEYAVRQVRVNQFGFAEKLLRELGEAYREAVATVDDAGVVDAAGPIAS